MMSAVRLKISRAISAKLHFFVPFQAKPVCVESNDTKVNPEQEVGFLGWKRFSPTEGTEPMTDSRQLI